MLGKATALERETVFHFRGHLRIQRMGYNAISSQSPKLVTEHLLVMCSFDLIKVPHVPAEIARRYYHSHVTNQPGIQGTLYLSRFILQIPCYVPGRMTSGLITRHATVLVHSCLNLIQMSSHNFLRP
jgi:hypothetical protein